MYSKAVSYALQSLLRFRQIQIARPERHGLQNLSLHQFLYERNVLQANFSDKQRLERSAVLNISKQCNKATQVHRVFGVATSAENSHGRGKGNTLVQLPAPIKFSEHVDKTRSVQHAGYGQHPQRK